MTLVDDALRHEIADLRTDIQALTAGLMQMVDVQEAHGDLLRELGEALNQEPDGPNPIAEKLEEMAATIRDHGATIERLSLRLTSATLRGVASADD